MLADGSEYRGDYDPGDTALRDLHAPRMEALLEAGADLLAIETVPTVREARVLVALLDELGATGWLSYQCRDGGHTAAGEPIAEAVAAAASPWASSPSASTARPPGTCRPSSPEPLAWRRTCHASPIRTAATAGTR